MIWYWFFIFPPKKKNIAKIASFGEKLNFSHLAICSGYIQSYSIVLRRFNIAIYFPNHSRPMLAQTVAVQVFPSLKFSFFSPATRRHSYGRSFESRSSVRMPSATEQDNIILCFYLSSVRANIKVAAPKATSTTTTHWKNYMKICTIKWSIKWHWLKHVLDCSTFIHVPNNFTMTLTLDRHHGSHYCKKIELHT